MIGLMLQVLTPMQVAHFIVKSYPFGPDMMALLDAVAARQPSRSQELLVIQFSNHPSSSSGPALPKDWRIAQSLPISRLRQRL